MTPHRIESKHEAQKTHQPISSHQFPYNKICFRRQQENKARIKCNLKITGMSTTGATEILIGIIPFGLDADAADSLVGGTANLAWSLCPAFNETADPSLTKQIRSNAIAEQANISNFKLCFWL